MAYIIFDSSISRGDEERYIEWLQNNNGFALKVERDPDSVDGTKIQWSKCGHAKHVSGPKNNTDATNTGGKSFKVCSDSIEEIYDYLFAHNEDGRYDCFLLNTDLMSCQFCKEDVLNLIADQNYVRERQRPRR